MTNEEEFVVKNVLRTLVFKIRVTGVVDLIYTYYTESFDEMVSKDRKKIKYDFDSLKHQINKNMLSNRKDYWKDIKDSQITLVEKVSKTKDFEKFRDYVEKLFSEDIEKLRREFKEEALAKQQEETNSILEILKDNENREKLIPPIKLILENNREFPYKSDKITAFLVIYLTTEQILGIMNSYESLKVTRGYIEKLKQEYEEKNKKYTPLTLDEGIKKIMKSK